MLLEMAIDLPEEPVALLQRPLLREGAAAGGAGRAAGGAEREPEVRPAAARAVTRGSGSGRVACLCSFSPLAEPRRRRSRANSGFASRDTRHVIDPVHHHYRFIGSYN
jgi:hypothetical protein